MAAGPRNQLFRLALFVMIGLLALNATLSLMRSYVRASDTGGGIDFHPYWYSGHFVRQGEDPYGAYLTKQEPALPVRYLDGVTTNTPPLAVEGLTKSPANTAPVVLLLSSFSLLSWPVASTIWLVCSLALTLVTPWLVIRLMPPDLFDRTQKLIIYLVFYGFSSNARVAIWTGQTALLIFVLMLGTLLTLKRRGLAGILLGLALSKYSLALPVLLLVLYKRRFATVAIALGVQVLGILVIVLFAPASPFTIVQAYIAILQRHSGLEGIQFATLFGEQTTAANVIGVVATLGMAALLWHWLAQSHRLDGSGSEMTLVDFHLLVILTLWSLLIGYHRIYDTAAAILFVALGLATLAQPSLWNLNGKTSYLIGGVLVLFVFVQILPGEIAGVLLPAGLMPRWLQLVSHTITLSLLMALVTSLWLFYRVLAPAGNVAQQRSTLTV